MKKSILLFVLFALLLFGCSEKVTTNSPDSQATPPSMAEEHDLQFILPDTLTGLQGEDIDYNGQTVLGYALHQFVNQDSVNNYTGIQDADSRILFAIQAVSTDEDGNWSPRKKGYYDLPWEQFKNGFYLPEESKRLYFPDENILNVYNVRFAKYLRLYRKIDVVIAEKIIIFETGAFDSEPIIYYKDDVEYNEEGYTIKNFISEYVTKAPQNYNYKFITADGLVNSDSNNMFTWETLQNSYWLTSKNRAIFLDDAMHTKYESVKFLQKIELIPITE